MLDLGLIGFAQPWLLLALIGLPVIWLLLRVTPPSPRRLTFPAIRLLFGLVPKEQTPSKTPLWLLLLRLVLAGLIILALAQPLLNPAKRLYGSGPLVLVVDDGWAAARHWSRRQIAMEGLLAKAEREGRPVHLALTAPGPDGESPGLGPPLTSAEARGLVQRLAPKPWPADRAALRRAIEGVTLEGTAHVVWLSDGLLQTSPADEVRGLAAGLQRLGRLDVIKERNQDFARLLQPPANDALGVTIQVARATADGPESLSVQGFGENGEIISQTKLDFAADSQTASAQVDLPAELRNKITRLQIVGEDSAAAVLLLDERWRRRPVGLVTTVQSEGAQPLLSEAYYLERALAPFTELRKGSTAELLQRDLAVLALPDASGNPVAEDLNLLMDWVSRGGVLVRFSGPNLAEAVPETLPVTLRQGDRILGGPLTWTTPARLAPFPEDGPFRGLAVPDDVVIQRQVLAEPALDLPQKTWAGLSDGTPLVTAEKRERGWVVLFHTTANTDWSNLAISGLFVDMLRRILRVSQGVATEDSDVALPPLMVLNGAGTLVAPNSRVTSLTLRDLGQAGAVGPLQPPGFYGKQGTRHAHNLGATIDQLQPIPAWPNGVTLSDFRQEGERNLKPYLLLAAFLLFLGDFAATLVLRGFALPTSALAKAGGKAAALVLAALCSFALSLPGKPLLAQTGSEARALEATLQTRLAYVRTDLPHIDSASRSGLSGLTRILQLRTSIEAGPPMEVDPEQDELAFYPLLYWPVTAQADGLSAVARRKVQDYMRNGGTILFDLRDPGAGAQMLGRDSSGNRALQRLLEDVEIPPLSPVPPDHVLTKAFYLMQEFPGRYMGGTLWVGSESGGTNDGVTSIIIGSNDWASAWAVDRIGQPLHALVPGGARQRELAYRFGVNLVMYALTGNYKADQVHIPFILERLGQ